VRIRYRPDGVAIEIVDAGNGPSLATDVEGGGHGLVGMRERVRLFGGELEAGPMDGGGFRVSAHLPRERAGVPA
jgi:signal transduction histidine kinase